MSSAFEKFDKQVDLSGLLKDIEDAGGNRGTFREVPCGTYEVSIDKAELRESKKGDPMVSIWFKIVAGEHKGSRIFLNQVVTQGFQIHIVNNLLISMGLHCVETLRPKIFRTYVQYETLIQDVYEECDTNHLTFELSYGKNDKGFNTFEIEEVFEN